jgi:hypothetical protein
VLIAQILNTPIQGDGFMKDLKSDWKTGQICPGHEDNLKCGLGKVKKTYRAGDCGVSNG